jgi:isoleucyl-tRNA synthetase
MSIDFPKIENKILKFWEEKKIFEKLRRKNRGKKRWSFLDGPITANNPMGVHHAWGRTYKDLFRRYKAMQGIDERYQNGFDCQGLWVEVEVEKELGFKNKKDIEKYGIGKFVQKCKERALKYSKIQTRQSIRLGQWMDWGNSYYTMSDENNYAIWHFLKRCQEKGLLYKGRDVVPWCPRCGTAISQHEILTEEYQEICHKSVFVKLPIVGQKNTFFLAWTTTPWTLPSNVSLAVHPDLEYAKIKDGKENIFVLLKDKFELIPDGKIIDTFKGRKLEGIKYQGMFDELPEVKETLKNYKHAVILWDGVSPEEGTGIVHTAPGCGQEDFHLSKELKIPVINPTNDESRYEAGFGLLSGKLVTEVNNLIFEDLTKKNLVFKIKDYIHRYPTCWRCKSELIFRLVDEWYISMEKLRKGLMKSARKIKWIPPFGLERELDWLKNMQDWLISKKRYWGLALPIYECPKCGSFEVIGSKKELKEKAIEGWKEFEDHSPHRPWVDKVKIRCSKCGQTLSRIPDVGNPWLDAGIVSFSTIKYFSDKDFWKRWFPVDFISESFPGQFKNWFYSLLVMSQVLEDCPPTKTIFGYAMVVDEKGEEMHKSKGNAIWFDEAVEKIGADVMRWMYAKQNPVCNLRFGYKVAEETRRKLLTLWNSYVFYNTYADKRGFQRRFTRKSISGNQRNYQRKSAVLLDKWILSRLNGLIKKVTEFLDDYDASRASLAIENFFINDLSLWYIRRSRKRFHPSPSFALVKGRETKKEAVATLYFVLLNLVKLIAPIMPFFSEEVYQKISNSQFLISNSVHLEDWPKVDKKLINKKLEKKMERVREIVALALAKRAKAGIKVRQPLQKLTLRLRPPERQRRVKKNGVLRPGQEIDKELIDLIKDEINVKEIVFDSKIKGEIELDTKINPQLKEEGIIREVIRHIQEMRKKMGLKPKDKILVFYFGSQNLNEILFKNRGIIMSEGKIKDFKIKSRGKFDFEKEIKVDQEKLYLAIKKLE